MRTAICVFALVISASAFSSVAPSALKETVTGELASVAFETAAEDGNWTCEANTFCPNKGRSIRCVATGYSCYANADHHSRVECIAYDRTGRATIRVEETCY